MEDFSGALRAPKKKIKNEPSFLDVLANFNVCAPKFLFFSEKNLKNFKKNSKILKKNKAITLVNNLVLTPYQTH